MENKEQTFQLNYDDNGNILGCYFENAPDPFIEITNEQHNEMLQEQGGINAWQIKNGEVVKIVLSPKQVLEVARTDAINLVNFSCGQTILATYPDYTQRNINAAATISGDKTALTEMQTWIDAKRAIAQDLKDQINAAKNIKELNAIELTNKGI